MKLDLDFRSDIPLTNQIVTQIQQQMANGALHVGDQMPTVRALALDLRINFNTVARAYRILDEVGVISTQQGRGTFILEQPPPETNQRLRHESLEALARRYLAETKRLGFSRETSLLIFQEMQEAEKETNNT
ncbi:MAG: GntR family transcriptional regulator [Anaerolineales bacterium]|jgi:GntR family transcriptional regulator|nr:GntR family transcriptional regulator [Anaerolineales bacterium]